MNPFELAAIALPAVAVAASATLAFIARPRKGRRRATPVKAAR